MKARIALAMGMLLGAMSFAAMAEEAATAAPADKSVEQQASMDKAKADESKTTDKADSAEKGAKKDAE